MRLKLPENKEKIFEIYKNLLENNGKIFILDEELNPKFYKELLTNWEGNLEGKSINIIAGPYIAIEDELFRKYHDLHNDFLGYWWYATRKGEWEKIHPLFEVTNKNNNINLFITKYRLHNQQFVVGRETKEIISYPPHPELSDNHSLSFTINENLVREKISLWNKINNSRCYKWDKTLKRKTLFKPISCFLQEQELESKLNIV